MTGRRYLRLCLVLIVPLLLAGFLLAQAKFMKPKSHSYLIVCRPSVNEDWCRHANETGEGSFYDFMKKESDAWASVWLSDDEKPLIIDPMVEFSTRIILDAKIVNAKDGVTSGERSLSLPSLIGRSVDIVFGGRNGDQSFISDSSAILLCDTLDLSDHTHYYADMGKTSGTYAALCSGDGWRGRVVFSVNSKYKAELESLRSSIAIGISEAQADYIIYSLVVYPFLFYMFLILSGVWWLTLRAVAFVKRG